MPRVAQRAGQRQELSLRPVSWRQGSRAGVLGRCPRARLAFTLGIGLPRPGPSKALPRGRWPVFSATRRFWSPDSAVTPRQPEHSLGQRPPSPPPSPDRGHVPTGHGLRSPSRAVLLATCSSPRVSEGGKDPDTFPPPRSARELGCAPGWAGLGLGQHEVQLCAACPSQGISGGFPGRGREGAGPSPAGGRTPLTTAVGSPFQLFPTEQPGFGGPVTFRDGGPEVKFPLPPAPREQEEGDQDRPCRGAGEQRQGSIEGGVRGGLFGDSRSVDPTVDTTTLGAMRQQYHPQRPQLSSRGLRKGCPAEEVAGCPGTSGVQELESRAGGVPETRRGSLEGSQCPFTFSSSSSSRGLCFRGLGFPAEGVRMRPSCGVRHAKSHLPAATGKPGVWVVGHGPPGRSEVGHLGSTGERRDGRKGRKKEGTKNGPTDGERGEGRGEKEEG